MKHFNSKLRLFHPEFARIRAIEPNPCRRSWFLEMMTGTRKESMGGGRRIFSAEHGPVADRIIAVEKRKVFVRHDRTGVAAGRPPSGFCQIRPSSI